MAVKEAPSVKVWDKKGKKTETHTVVNARDLVMHAGWHYADPNKAPATVASEEAEEKSSGNDGSTSFDDKVEVDVPEAPKEEAKVDVPEAPKEEAKVDVPKKYAPEKAAKPKRSSKK